MAIPKNDLLLYISFHGALFAITSYIAYLSNPGTSLFSWHPFLMTLSMVMVGNEAVIIFSPQWSLLPKKFQRKLYLDSHAILEGIAFTCALFGFVAIYNHKENIGKPHFKSWHGFLGIVQILMLIAQMLGGVISKYPNLVFKKLSPNTLKTCHSISGISVITLGTVNLVLGLLTKWFVSQSNLMMSYLLSIATVIIGSYISIRAATTNSRINALLGKK